MDSISFRCCSSCGQEKPANTEYFRLDKRSGKLSGPCRACHREYSRRYRQEHPEKAKAAVAQAYAKRGDSYRETRRQYALNHADKVRSCNHNHYIRNRHQIILRTKLWRSSNPHKVRIHQYNYRARNLEKIRLSNEIWRRSNLESARVRNRNYKARKKQASGSHNVTDVKNKITSQGGKCYWCAKVIEGTYHVDHIIALALGGSNGPENICISCPDCNFRKSAKTPWDFAGRLL